MNHFEAEGGIVTKTAASSARSLLFHMFPCFLQLSAWLATKHISDQSIQMVSPCYASTGVLFACGSCIIKKNVQHSCWQMRVREESERRYQNAAEELLIGGAVSNGSKKGKHVLQGYEQTSCIYLCEFFEDVVMFWQPTSTNGKGKCMKTYHLHIGNPWSTAKWCAQMHEVWGMQIVVFHGDMARLLQNQHRPQVLKWTQNQDALSVCLRFAVDFFFCRCMGGPDGQTRPCTWGVAGCPPRPEVGVMWHSRFEFCSQLVGDFEKLLMWAIRCNSLGRQWGRAAWKKWDWRRTRTAKTKMQPWEASGEIHMDTF